MYFVDEFLDLMRKEFKENDCNVIEEQKLRRKAFFQKMHRHFPVPGPIKNKIQTNGNDSVIIYTFHFQSQLQHHLLQRKFMVTFPI